MQNLLADTSTEEKMKIKIDAIDTLFFKDGKPFSMGEESWADGIFPPPPSVIYGSLRSAYFGENPQYFNKANKIDDPTKNLKILGIHFSIGGEEYYPIPFDLVKKKSEKKDKAYLMKPNKSIPLNSSSFLNDILSPEFDDEIEAVEGGLISQNDLYRYLNGKEKEFYYLPLSNFIQSEPKVGIGRDNATHSTSDGKLYRVGMKRLEEKKDFQKESNTLSLIIEFEGIQLQKSGFLKLGAEGKVAHYEEIKTNNEHRNNEQLKTQDETLFKLYLSTPALFKNGWIPDLNNNPLLKDLELEIISVCLSKPQNIGGFDMQKKLPKPMRKVVPAGSVYIFKTKPQNFSKIYKRLNGESISDYNTNEGYGIAFVGGAL